MDSVIIVAIINAAGALAGRIFDAWNKTSANAPSSKTEIKIENALHKVIASHYSDYQSGLTTNSVKALRFLETGEPQSTRKIWRYVFPNKKYVNEFEYRLRYIEAIGLIKGSLRTEFRITRLGRAFLEEARKRGDFKTALHP